MNGGDPVRDIFRDDPDGDPDGGSLDLAAARKLGNAFVRLHADNVRLRAALGAAEARAAEAEAELVWVRGRLRCGECDGRGVVRSPGLGGVVECPRCHGGGER